MFKVIIAGGRDFSDYPRLKQVVTHLLANQASVVIVCGEAKGADRLGRKLAMEQQWVVESYPAEWETLGRSAGYLRNKRMAENADALIAFWDGRSKGTKHMIDTAKSRGLKIRVVYY